MRIAIATGPFQPPPPGPAGAVERLSFDLARHFVAQGHEVTMVGRSSPGIADDATLDGVRILRQGKYKSTRSIPLNLVKDFFYSRRLIRLMPSADIWMTNTFWLPVFALRRPAPSRPALVVGAHRFPKYQYTLYRGIDRIIAVSSTVAKAIARQTPWTEAITSVIPNPVDTATFKPRSTEKPANPLILFTGRIHQLKGLDILVQAAALLATSRPRLRLRLVGPWDIERGGGGPAYLAHLRQLAGPATLELPGPIFDRPALAKELAAASVYVYPSIDERGEALPIAPMEAMAVGLPVIVSNLPCFNEFLSPGTNGLTFDHQGPAARHNLAAALASILDDPALSCSLSLSAAATIPNFSNERTADRYLREFSLIHKTKPDSPCHWPSR